MLYHLFRHKKQIVQPVFTGVGTVCFFQPFKRLLSGMCGSEFVSHAAGFFHVYNLAAADISADHLRVVCRVGKPQDASPGMSDEIELFLAVTLGQECHQCMEILEKGGDGDDAVSEIVI